MKEELIKLATSKKFGFSSKFLYQVAYKYSTKEDLRYLFWLTELQKWLLETCNVDVFSYSVRFQGYEEIGYYTYSIKSIVPVKNYRFDSYKLALETGLYQALLSI